MVLYCTGRYRIQGSSLEALCVLSHELVRRLSLYYRNQRPADEAKKSAGASEPLVFGFTENLPLHDLFVAIDEHFQVPYQQRVFIDHPRRKAELVMLSLMDV